MIIYNGGSQKDEKLWPNENLCPNANSDLLTGIKSSENCMEISGNQIFIEFTSDGYGSKKNFSSSISFGIRAK